MFKSLKKSSPDKSASLGRSSSLRSTGNDTTSTGIDPVLEARFKSLQEMLGAFLRSISNDTSTGTDPILEANFKSAQIRLGALNKEYGDVQKIGTDPNQFNYSKAQKEYKNLYDDIKTSKFSLEKEQQDSLLFGIYHGLAISAFRAGKFKEHNEHLLHAYDKYSPDRDKSIIGLEIWVKIYKNLGANAQKVPSISSQCDKLLKEVETEVQSLIKAGGYDQARTKMEYLNKNSHNFQIFELYASTIKDPKEAFKYLKEKSDKYNPIQRQDIYEIFKTLQEKFNKAGETKLAEEAATYALKYNPNPTVATASAAPVVSPEVKKAEKEFEKLKEKYDEAAFKLKTVVTLDVHTKQLEELRTKHEAELEKLKTEHKAELEALKPKASPTKDTKVNDAGDFSPTSSLPPPYTSKVNDAGDFSPTSSLPPPYTSVDIGNHKYLQLVKNATTTPTAPTAPVVKVVTPLAEEVLNELTKLAHLIPSLNWQDSQYNTTKGKAKSLLSEAVKENPDVYKTIEDPKILVLLADVLLSSNKMEEARIVCKKALDADPNIWQATDDQIVLLNLAGVLLLSFSNEPKAKEVYSKVISMRIYSKDEHGSYKIDDNRTSTASKTVAQNGYNDAERDCLVKVCLSSPKVYQQAQALDCYPHTDVTKRHEIALQLKQLGKQALKPAAGEYKAYALYTKAFSVLKDDQELLQDMKKAHEYASFTSYPPTDESTAYLIGECAHNNY